MSTDNGRHCIGCQEPIEGRKGKLFCSVSCKSAYHYARKREEEKGSLYQTIDEQLKLNRRLLQHFNRSGKSTIRVEKLLMAGFNPHYFTHYWKNQKGQVYLFCYDVGFLSLEEHARKKYLIIDWQDYMRPSNGATHHSQ